MQVLGHSQEPLAESWVFVDKLRNWPSVVLSACPTGPSPELRTGKQQESPLEILLERLMPKAWKWIPFLKRHDVTRRWFSQLSEGLKCRNLKDDFM